MPDISNSRAGFQTLQFQAALVEISRVGSATLNDALARITALAADALEVARVSIWMFNDDQTELRCLHLFDRVYRDCDAQESGAILEVGKYPRYFKALQESRTIAADDARTDASTSEFAYGYLDVLNIFAMLDVPIRREGRVAGVLCNEHTGSSRSWRVDEQNFAASLADLIALVFETDRRREVERELRKSFDQLELFFSQSLDGFFFMMLDEPVRWDDSVDKEKVLDYIFEHQRITKVNDAMLRLHGASREQVLGRRPMDVFAHNPVQGRQYCRQMLDAGHRHGESEERRLDGTPVWLDGDYICIYDLEGRFTGNFGVQRDITARKQAEHALRRYSQRLKLLRQTDRAILSARSVHEIAEAVLARFHELVPCPRASVSVVEPGGVTARLVGVLPSERTQLGIGSHVPLDLFGDPDDLRQGRPYVVPNVAHLAISPTRAALEADGIRSIVAVPLLANGELIGTLNLGSNEIAAFSAEHVEIAQDVADSLAVAIRHAHLNQQVAHHAADLERRVAERTMELSDANIRIRESEERVRALYNNTPIMMHSVDENGRILDVNEFWLQTLGYERSEVIGRPVANYAAPEYQTYVRDDLMPRLAREGFLKDAEVQASKKNGERVDLQISSVVKKDGSGKFLFSQTFLLDITERKRAERAHKETEERLAGIFRSAMDAIVVIDSERRIVIFNEAAEKVFRCDSSEAVGRRMDAFLSEQLEQTLSGYIASAGSGSPQSWIPEGLRAVRKNGEQFPIEATVSRTDVSTGRLFTIILRDIGQRKQSEEMLDQLQRENVYLQEELQSELNFEEIVGGSPAIQKVFTSIEMVAQTDSTVLLLGETGTGKELIARALHNRSQRRQSVMVKVNCGALPASLVESELFGHEKGAFTGAVLQKKGRFELAHRGTIFLDEVGELPLETQSKLLRVLQEQEFERVGGSQTQKVDVRVIAATNRDLEEEVRRGAFRADLFYRLNVFPIEVPPLRERMDDIPLLAGYFVRKFSQRMGKRIQGINRAVYEQLQQYDWPGNVRELANLLERAVILCQSDILELKHLAVNRPRQATARPSEGLPTLEEAERRLILRALEQTGGTLAGPNGAAEILGLNRSTLWSRMKKLGIELPKHRGALASRE
ncbi:MAG: diguanylate cyclase [Bryobacterales bacterium]|nr:diguanylate cyclase [Bryobacterales bacterium]